MRALHHRRTPDRISLEKSLQVEDLLVWLTMPAWLFLPGGYAMGRTELQLFNETP
ncbi:MAG: hypothetical protein ACR2OZ_03045 [Verrucomicrobiales bacterium]